VASLGRFPALAAFLAGHSARWPDLGIAPDELTALCEAEQLWPLVHERLAVSGGSGGWPSTLRDALSERARRYASEELLRGAETRAVIDALAQAGVQPILIKGTPLAYGWYTSPASRPRDDTDVLIPSAGVAIARDVLAALEYTATVHCSDLFSQFEVQKADRFGLTHAFDVHWRISTQPVFAELLTHEELLPRTVPIPALGASAIAPCAIDALLLACVHPVMHHRSSERVLWIYDIHLLASALSVADFDRFARLVQQKKVAAICAHRLRLSQAMFGTLVPADVVAALSLAQSEPSAEYLASDRRWHHELVSSVRALQSLGERMRLLRSVLFPSPAYMLGAYGLRDKPLRPWILPALYMHRALRGVWKIMSGRK
jgi:hypothetical protein